jgi:hypothetical protein
MNTNAKPGGGVSPPLYFPLPSYRIGGHEMKRNGNTRTGKDDDEHHAKPGGGVSPPLYLPLPSYRIGGHGTERNRTEQNGTERNRTERKHKNMKR